MAKLKAPLFSLGASGAIGKALVFFGWKGLDVVREYVVPSNPQTGAQTKQRDYLKDVVKAIHTAQGLTADPLDSDDITALAYLGSTRPTPRTWFNEQVKLWLDCKVLEDIPIIYRNGKTDVKTRVAVQAGLAITEETGTKLSDGKFFMGKTKTALIHPYEAVCNAPTYVALAPTDISGWASVGDKIFWQFRPDALDDCEGANSGIYTFIAEA